MLLALGAALTLLLRLSVPSTLFHAEAIYLPALCSSALGLLGQLWALASSARYALGAAAAAGVALAAASTLAYGALLLHAHRRIGRVRRAGGAGAGYGRARSGEGADAGGDGARWQEDRFYTNWVANMHPTARPPRGPGAAPPTEEDMMRARMAALLRRPDAGPSAHASRATFRIDMPAGGEEAEGEEEGERDVAEMRGRRGEMLGPGRDARARAGSGGGSVGCGGGGGGGGRAGSDASGDGSAWSRYSGASEGGERDGLGAGGSRRVRAVSREDRRVEIEMGRVDPRGSLYGA